MTFRESAFIHAWMDDIEQDLAKRTARELRLFLKQHHVADSPFLTKRLEAYVIECTFLYRTGRGLEAFQGGRLNEPDNAKAYATLSETYTKQWERIRKLMNEIETYCAKAGTPVDLGLADKVRPILDRAKGVMDILVPACAGGACEETAANDAIDSHAEVGSMLET